MRAAFPLGVVAACLAVAALACISIAYGSTVIPMPQVLTALARAAGIVQTDPAGVVDRIIVDLRLPRAILAIAVGAGLGVIGLLLQTVTRNDLADPFLFGLSAGAAAGAVIVITRLGDRLGVLTLPIAAFVGGMCATGIVLMLIRRAQGFGPERLILAGLAVSFLFTALTNYLVFSGDQRAAHSVLFWTMGGLGLASWQNIGIGITGAAVATGYAMARHRHLDALLGGEQTAESLGISVRRLRRETFLAASFATALLVSITGVIGFIGLMIPHVARTLVGPLHKRLTILCALLGAALLLGSDLIARTLLPPQELPVGIVTSSIGAAFVVIVILQKGRAA
ncbi:iron complex transport system permease protein [Rhizobium sp. PP-F2F-G38]|nr:iron complex transport system permease protein [Rhizobium sp. PP-WC-1G-195]PYE96800.1 iron complex transport system permease protein [Rhizobium sp. PP-F2F-G38]TCP86213.1 iron complex transport system permease protein [Rhizobium sp. PP-CC-2G-626]TCQ23515.1 iron complex transport system permease protein [Rhizobium sp. PP-CC-3G-465]